MPRGGSMFVDITGQQFGHLTVLHQVESQDRRAMWLCQCDCGNQITVSGHHLRTGHTTSCGHIKHEIDRTKGRLAGYDANRIDGVAAFLLDEKRKVRTDNSTGVTGVKVTHTRIGEVRYVATITVAGVRHHLGTFGTLDEAVQARRAGEARYIPKQG